MKKLLILIIALVMALSLSACGGVPAEKLTKMDSIVSNLEVLINETKTELEKTNNTGYDDVQAYYDTNIAAYEQMLAEFNNMEKALNDNKSNMNEEQVDAAITGLEEMQKQLTEAKTNAVQEAAVIQDAIKQTEAAQASADVVTIPVTIQNNTGVDFYALAMSPANEETWGENLLTEVLVDGSSGVTEMTFSKDTLVWDILVQDQAENQLSFMGVDFSEAPMQNATLVMVVQDGGYIAVFAQ